MITRREAISELKDSLMTTGYQCHQETYEIALRSLEAWDEVLEDIDELKKSPWFTSEENLAARIIKQDTLEIVRGLFIEKRLKMTGIEKETTPYETIKTAAVNAVFEEVRKICSPVNPALREEEEN